jgi:glycosyltransferase involved in cell wall biosynthesis
VNIIFCISSLGSGGAERALSDLANHYAKEGHTVSLLTLVSSDTLPFYPVDPRIELIQTNKSSKGKASILRRIGNVSSSLFGIRGIVKRLKADVVVSFIDLMNVRVLLACWGLGVPVIVSERTDPAYHQLPLKTLSEWLRLKLYPIAHRVVVQTQAAAGYFPQTWHQDIKIVPNVVKKPKRRKQSSFDNITTIVTVGRLSPEKNHQALILAFSEWVKQYPDLRLNIYGEGPERNNLQRMIVDLSLEKKISLPGATQDIQEALLAADLFVFPSLYEGFPNALCEAMAIGLPVVASNCSGNAEVIQDGVNGQLFSLSDPDALRESVLKLLQNPSQCKAIAKNAATITERYGPEKVYGLWDSLILAK